MKEENKNIEIQTSNADRFIGQVDAGVILKKGVQIEFNEQLKLIRTRISKLAWDYEHDNNFDKGSYKVELKKCVNELIHLYEKI